MLNIALRILMLSCLLAVSACSTLTDVAREGTSIEVIQKINEGGDINKADEFGVTPVRYAVARCQAEPLEHLIKRGALLRDGASLIKTAITAMERGHDETRFSESVECERVLKALIKNGAVLDAPDEDDPAPLSQAILSGHLHTANLLIESGANVNSLNRSGVSPLLILAAHIQTVRGGDVPGQLMSKPKDRVTELDIARKLIELGANVNHTGYSGGSTSAIAGRHYGTSTPLLLAAQAGKTEMVDLLLKKGAKVNSISATGNTPLTWAARGGYVDIVQMLLENGAETGVINKEGFAALDLAKSGGHAEVVRMLAGKTTNSRAAEVSIPQEPQMTQEPRIRPATPFLPF